MLQVQQRKLQRLSLPLSLWKWTYGNCGCKTNMTLKFSFSCKIIKGRKAASERTETNGSLALLNLPVALFCEDFYFSSCWKQATVVHILEKSFLSLKWEEIVRSFCNLQKSYKFSVFWVFYKQLERMSCVETTSCCQTARLSLCNLVSAAKAFLGFSWNSVHVF